MFIPEGCPSYNRFENNKGVYSYHSINKFPLDLCCHKKLDLSSSEVKLYDIINPGEYALGIISVTKSGEDIPVALAQVLVGKVNGSYMLLSAGAKDMKETSFTDSIKLNVQFSIDNNGVLKSDGAILYKNDGPNAGFEIKLLHIFSKTATPFKS